MGIWSEGWGPTAENDVFTGSTAGQITSSIITVSATGQLALGALGQAAEDPQFIGEDLVLFTAESVNLVENKIFVMRDVLIKNLVTGEVTLVSKPASAAFGNDQSYYGSAFPGGDLIVFGSGASNFVAGDTPATYDLFVKSLSTGAISMVSASATGERANGHSGSASASSDGVHVAFYSHGNNLVANDTNQERDVFVKNILTGAIVRVSTNSAGEQGGAPANTALFLTSTTDAPQFSPDGKWLAFRSELTGLVAGDTNAAPDIFLKNLETGATIRVSTGAGGEEATYTGSVERRYGAGSALFSADGNSLIFHTYADLVAADTNGTLDVYIKNLETGALTLVSANEDGAFGGASGKLSPNGRYVAFMSWSGDVVAGDENETSDIFIKDLVTGDLQRVSVRNDGAELNGYSSSPSWSPSGDALVYASDASNLTGDYNEQSDIVLVDLGINLDDNVSGRAGNDTLNGGAGNDILDGGLGNDALNGGAGADTASYSDKDITVGVTVSLAIAGAQNTIGAGADTLVEIENLSGSRFNDTLTGNASANTLTGGAGNDVLNGGAGADVLQGGLGNDTMYVDNAGDSATEDLNAGVDLVVASRSWAVGSNIEKVTLTGTGDFNVAGNGLANNLKGNSGDNWLNGSFGKDTLTGGGGRDSFIFNRTLGANNIDTITDYDVVRDVIRIDNAVFAGIGPAGALAAGAFNTGASATQADDRIIYDQTTGKLFFDIDGVGSAAQVHFATLSTKPAGMSAGEFIII